VRRVACLALIACGGSSAPKPTPAVIVTPAITTSDPDADKRREQAKHDDIVASHRKLEEEQQSALALGCTEPKNHEKHERCLPSCYATEPADPRAGKRLSGNIELAHLVCEQDGGYALADELDPKLAVRGARGRPASHKPGSWQQTIEAALAEAHRPKLGRGEAYVVTGAWRTLEHPLTKARLRCVTATLYLRPRRPLDGCGADGTLACEATGNGAARAINVAHYRLAEAQRLQTAGKTAECQQAALEAVAVARGLPRWRQYVKLNIAKWIDHPGYRTRFDGILDEDALVAKIAAIGGEAEQVYVACGGAAGAPTKAAQEQSFHTCW
jgi:hypothetical protein